MKKENKKIIYSILAVIVVVMLVSGGTFAWWTWTSLTNTTTGAGGTNTTFTISGGSMTISGANVSGFKFAPTNNCKDSNHAVATSITVTTTDSTATTMTGTLYFDVSGLPANLRTANLKYVISETNSCTTSSPTGTFASANLTTDSTFGGTYGTTANLLKIALPASTADTNGGVASNVITVNAGKTYTKTYYIFIWLDSAETSTSTQGLSATITYKGKLVQNAT